MKLLINQSMTDGGACRTALGTLGLLTLDALACRIYIKPWGREDLPPSPY